MKIFHVIEAAPYGGAERQMERLTAVLAQAGHTQHVLLAGDTARAPRFRALGVEVVEMAFPSFFSFMDRRRIRAEIARFAPDILMSWSPSMSALVEKGSYNHIGVVGGEFDAPTYSSCDHLLFAAQVRAEKATGWSAEKIHVIPGLLSASAELTDVKAPERRRYYTPPKDKLVLTAARLVPDKGIDVLIKAVARLSGVYLWIAGDGEAREACETFALENGVKPRVRFLGWQDDLTPFLRAADVFVYPARQEELGTPIAEAWAAGVPVIAADTLGPGLIIRHNENGLLVPVNDHVSLAEGIKWVCGDKPLSTRLAEAGRLSFQESFATDKVVPKYLDLLSRLSTSKPA